MGALSLTVRPVDGWSILFAKEPEPDLELDDMLDDLDNRPSPNAPYRKPRRTSSRKPIHWVMFLLIVGAGAVFAYDPEFVMELFGQGYQPSTPIVSTVPRPKRTPTPATPSHPVVLPNAISAAPALPSAPPAVAAVPHASAPAASQPSANPIPLFSEGQRVVVLADPALPAETVSLSPDPTGSAVGPTVRAGTVVTVLDGELRETTGWVYSVRSVDGLMGWIPEKRLRQSR